MFPVAMRFGVTPVPIPNTTVKTKTAESTILATVWEDRWLPDYKKKLVSLLSKRYVKTYFSNSGLIAQPVRAHA